jgi:metal-responsive CopG/Arc/MetJ family transcriptional regulator
VSPKKKENPGPGRPPIARGEDTIALTVRLSETQAERLDAYGEKLGAKSRAEAVRHLIDALPRRR